METKEIVADIAAGRHDDRIIDVLEAVQHRFVSTAASLRWKVTLDDLTVTEDDVTLDELAQVEQLTGRRWGALDPTTTAGDLAALLVVCLQTRKRLSEAKARARVGKIKANEILDHIRKYRDGDGPFDGAG